MGREYGIRPWEMRHLTLTEREVMVRAHDDEQRRTRQIEQQIGGG